VLDAAVAISAASGPDAISMREVAREAGVSHQAPYHHFIDRSGIFAAICEEGFRHLSEALLAPRPSIDSNMCESYVHFALQNPGHFRVMMRNDLCQLADYPSARFEADRAFDILVDEVKSLLGEGAESEVVKTQTAYMWSVGHGLATLLLDGPLELKLEGIDDMNTFIHQVSRTAVASIRA
jgi:AcrR family transcriptional regulator